MARVKMPSVSEAAAQILREVEADQRIKTAEVQILRGASQRPLTTDDAKLLMKLAETCRGIDIDNPEVDYDDLHNFMAQVNARRTP